LCNILLNIYSNTGVYIHNTNTPFCSAGRYFLAKKILESIKTTTFEHEINKLLFVLENKLTRSFASDLTPEIMTNRSDFRFECDQMQLETLLKDKMRSFEQKYYKK